MYTAMYSIQHIRSSSRGASRRPTSNMIIQQPTVNRSMLMNRLLQYYVYIYIYMILHKQCDITI